VRALNYLETVLSVMPAATDRLESWFARPVVKCLRNMGIITLGDLVRFINVYGYRWYSTIKGLGAQRAAQVVQWLILEQDHLNLLVSANVHEPKSKRELRVESLLPAVGQDSVALRQFGAGTLMASAMHRMQATPTLAGSQGDFRSHMANTLGANNDLEAVTAWLSRYNENQLPSAAIGKKPSVFCCGVPRNSRNPCPASTHRTARNTGNSCRLCPLPGSSTGRSSAPIRDGGHLDPSPVQRRKSRRW
jgi:hypothetical protein